MFARAKVYICFAMAASVILGMISLHPAGASATSHSTSSVLSTPVDFYGKSIDVLGLFGQEKNP